MKVCTLKHAHNSFEIDKKGKDSHKHIQSGSNEVIIYNERKWALISKKQEKKHNIEEIINKFNKHIGILRLIEGYKNAFRFAEENESEYLIISNADLLN